MGKIHKFTDKNGVGLYPVTISDAVAVTMNGGTSLLTKHLLDIDKHLLDIDSSVSAVAVKIGDYKIRVTSSAGQEANTIYFVI